MSGPEPEGNGREPEASFVADSLKGNALPLVALVVLVSLTVLIQPTSAEARVASAAAMVGAIAFATLYQWVLYAAFLRRWLSDRKDEFAGAVEAQAQELRQAAVIEHRSSTESIREIRDSIDGYLDLQRARDERLGKEGRHVVSMLVQKRAIDGKGIISDTEMAATEETRDELRTVVIVRKDGPDEFKDEDLRTNLEDYGRIVYTNVVDRGVAYHWICEANARSTQAIDEARRALAKHLNLVSFKPLEPAQWAELPTTFETIFLETADGSLSVYMRLPSADLESTRWLHIPLEVARDWAGTLKDHHRWPE